MMRRRSATSITLVLIGSAALHGCGEEEAGQRDVYRSQAECMQDWGNDSARCERVRSGNHSGYYYGPYYRGANSGRLAPGTTSPPRKGSSAIGSTPITKGSSSSSSVSRSGFGSTSSTHASSSS